MSFDSRRSSRRDFSPRHLKLAGWLSDVVPDGMESSMIRKVLASTLKAWVIDHDKNADILQRTTNGVELKNVELNTFKMAHEMGGQKYFSRYHVDVLKADFDIAKLLRNPVHLRIGTVRALGPASPRMLSTAESRQEKANEDPEKALGAKYGEERQLSDATTFEIESLTFVRMPKEKQQQQRGYGGLRSIDEEGSLRPTPEVGEDESEHIVRLCCCICGFRPYSFDWVTSWFGKSQGDASTAEETGTNADGQRSSGGSVRITSSSLLEGAELTELKGLRFLNAVPDTFEAAGLGGMKTSFVYDEHKGTVTMHKLLSVDSFGQSKLDRTGRAVSPGVKPLAMCARIVVTRRLTDSAILSVDVHMKVPKAIAAAQPSPVGDFPVNVFTEPEATPHPGADREDDDVRPASVGEILGSGGLPKDDSHEWFLEAMKAHARPRRRWQQAAAGTSNLMGRLKASGLMKKGGEDQEEADAAAAKGESNNNPKASSTRQSMFSRMLGMASVPGMGGGWLQGQSAAFSKARASVSSRFSRGAAYEEVGAKDNGGV